jgi:AAA+ ATPase superfamily predicted ATPase
MPVHNPDVIDREEESQFLRELLAEGAPRMALIYGRRRVGKTHLLNRVWPRERVFYFTAAETTEAQNREAILDELGRFRGESMNVADYPTWRTVFRLLLETNVPDPLVIVLDEFQYLGETLADVRRVASELNAIWEQRRAIRPVVVVLSGSHIKTMEALRDGGALFGRFHYTARITPFNYWYAGQMAPYPDLRDRVRAYAAYGGTPRYLAAINSAVPLDQNIAKHLLHPQGEVRALIETALTQERGLVDVAKYQAILRAIGTGGTSFAEIKSKAGMQNMADNSLRQMLDKLRDLCYVRAERNIGAKNTSPFQYRIDDPAFAFYFACTARYETALARHDPHQVWADHMRAEFNAYVGHVFERIAEQAYIRRTPALGLPALDTWGRWEGVDRAKESLEMDIVAPLVDGRVMTGGVKWNAAPLEPKWHYHHMAMIERLRATGIKWAHRAATPEAPLLWVAAGGFTPDFEAAARSERHEVYLWSLEDLYR